MSAAARLRFSGVVLVLLALWCGLVGCSRVQYRMYDKDFPGRGGFEDERKDKNTFNLKYSLLGDQYGGKLVKRFWWRRAAELCPDGYDYTFENAEKLGAVIFRYNLEGVVSCHSTLELE